MLLPNKRLNGDCTIAQTKESSLGYGQKLFLKVVVKQCCGLYISGRVVLGTSEEVCTYEYFSWKLCSAPLSSHNEVRY